MNVWTQIMPGVYAPVRILETKPAPRPRTAPANWLPKRLARRPCRRWRVTPAARTPW